MFEEFDPLQISDSAQIDESHIRERQKRNIHSILHSYVSWYDPFSELVQNALDSVDKRARNANKEYLPKISIRIDDTRNSLTVSDNGVGLEKEAFLQFLAPNVSFKDNLARGSKGVGATYLAYGFNYIHIDAKTKNLRASGAMEGARNWLHEMNAPANPKIYPVEDKIYWDPNFELYDSGVSVTVLFDGSSRPSDIKWPKLSSADSWLKALKIKTALGAILEKQSVEITVIHIRSDGTETKVIDEEVNYLAPHKFFSRSKRYEDVISKLEQAVAKKGADVSLPAGIKNLDAIYLEWTSADVLKNVDALSVADRDFIDQHPVRVLASYLYSARVWDDLSKKLGCRTTANIFAPGIQLAADNMPQGEMIQVPLKRYTGRQNQVHFVIHFENCIVDLGRKGFHKDFVDLAKLISREIVQKEFSKVKPCLRKDDFRKTDIIQQEKVSSWKEALLSHETTHPLILKNDNFFKPLHEVSVTAEPSREQDVIALFNQLVAGGVIRGVKVIGTNERMTYDGAFRILCGPNYSLHQYDATINPLGISESQREDFESSFPDGFLSTELKILEYKFSGDGLITDITTGDKKVSEMDLLIAWEMGTEYEQFFSVQSLLLPEGESFRQYHGVTHLLINDNGQHVMDAIILKDLISYLNNPEQENQNQSTLYE